MYKVTVDKIQLVTGTKQEYVKLADTGGKDGNAEYGYVTKRVEQLESTRVFEQTLERLSLAKLATFLNTGPEKGKKLQ